jgi:UDP-N-acetylglucosamine acyltransferase
MPIHPTAIVDPSAKVDASADIGPWCYIGSEVHVGARTRMMANIYAEGPTWIGEDNVFYPFSTVGVASQDKKYHGERAETRVGDRNNIREFVTIHRGTEGGGALTTIGSDNLLMAYAHIAHDVRMGSNCILANGATIGGHVEIGDWAVIAAFSGVHQFCRIGRHAMIGGYSVIVQDVMPFSTTVSSREVKVFGANRNGLERRGFSAEQIEVLQNALRMLTRGKLNTSQAIEKMRADLDQTAELEELIAFIESSDRGVVK